MTVHRSIAYVPHIDGLRALAILPVVAFHADSTVLTGGFTGVDIFFVISGYLLTRIILAEQAQGTFTILSFYKRRFLRILPAYGAVIIAVLMVGYVLLLPSELEELGRTIAAASLFVSNIYFWRTTNYFNQDQSAQPLLHTWTLSVEEQFYIVLPIMLMIAGVWFRRFVPHIIAALIVGSFVICLWAMTKSETAAFYLLPFRAWEFAAGAFIASVSWQDRLPAKLREALAAIGLALAVAGFLVLTHDSPFPGTNALLPVVGATLLIACAGGTMTGQLLALPPALWIGRISYSLYLWHWPVIVYYKLRYGAVLDMTDTAIVVAISVALSVISYEFIEKPFRAPAMRRGPAPRIVLTSLSTLVLAAAVGFGVSRQADNLRAMPADVARFDGYRDYQSTPEGLKVTSAGGCMLYDGKPGGFSGFDRDLCLPSQTDQPNVLVMGDSHAAHLMLALTEKFPQANVQRAAAAHCVPVIGTPNFSHDHYCAQLMRYLFDEFIPEQKPDAVILSARWHDNDIAPLQATVAALRKSVKSVVILGPTVEYATPLPLILGRAAWVGAGDANGHRRQGPCDLDTRMRDISWPQGVTYISMIDIICPPSGCRTTTADGAPYNFDYGHYTLPASREVAEALKRLQTLIIAPSSSASVQTREDARRTVSSN